MGDGWFKSAELSRMRCAFVGDQPLVAQCAEVARRSGLDVVLIATENESVREYAVDEGIDVVRAGAELTAGLDAHPADVLFSIANLRVIGADALRRVTTAINFHDGPLPGYAGLNVTTWAILQGERHHAITWHLMTADVDSGDIVTSESFPISADETAFSLNARCYEAALASFPRIVSQLVSATLATERQPHGERRMFMRHDRPARLLDPAVPAADSARAVRALDLGHRIRNTIGAARLVLGDRVLVVESAHVADDPSGAPIGTVVAIDGGVRVATADGDLMITAVAAADGTPVDLPHLLAQHGIRQGDTVPSPEPALVAAITALEPELARDEPFWLDRLGRTEPALPPGLGQGRARIRQRIEIPTRTDRATVIATVALWLARTTSIDTATFAVTSTEHRTELARLAPLVGEPVAMLHVAPEATFAELVEMGREELRQVDRRRTLLRDAIGRDPLTRERPLTMPVVVDLDVDDPGERFPDRDTSTLRIVVGSDHLELDAVVPDDDPDALDRIAGQLGTLLAAGVGSPDSPVFELPMLGRDELALLEAINRTDLTHDRTMTIDGLFHAQVARTPHAPALSSGDATLSYAEVGAAVTSMRTRLTSAGVGRGDRIGIAVSRSIDMVVSVLATLDLGAAYLPLDPSYPPERLGFMIDDAGIAVLVATGAMAVELRRPDVTVVDPTSPLHHHDTAPALFHDSGDLAYLIYTSGSTGRPKGVMLEHRQVTNFFVAMDHVIDHDPAGVWLAVTSLSFDISVLELLWTLTRGFHVVLKSDHGVAPHAPRVPKARATITRPVTFSLFYFAAGEAAAADGYRLLLDSARFADRNGFEAVWTPERHFHSFGGAYPNPSVTGAALAAITSSVGIRAGSVVLPLHSPLRVAEEWAVVDNLSGGRVGISFAAGWQPNDFVLNPAAYANAKEELPRSIETVQRLWRGETVTMPGHDGAAVDVHTLPRPVQPELPVWLTSAGSPATFERAGMLGVNVLTHLLGQSVDQLADNVERYRSAWRDAGHRGEGRVTLMMHTYLDHDADTAREVAREPMKGYLGTAVGLLRDVASAFPTFAGRGKGTDNLFASLTPAEMDQLLEVAAHRYLSTSGLFGTPDDAAAIVESVSAAGVDEVACLVDFGVPTDAVLASLELLLQAKEQVEGRRCEPPGDGPAESTSGEVDDSVAELVARHGVSHLQCTPSLAAMLAADPADRAALATIGHLMLGGEALPTSLAADLRELLPGRFTNMYGPTETTIWSLTHEIDTVPDGSIPIGAPIANTSIFVLDAHGCRLPVGSLGELHIGGLGVARGYHDRPDLNAQRFVERQGMGRVYATGDVVRIRPSGSVEFAGRSDNQVKIRGHRIEIGEIEAVLDRHPDVVQSVVVVRESGSDTRLVGYVIMHRSGDATSDVLRKHLAESLPEAMVPSVIVALDSFPLTPNGKIDRRALPVATGITGALATAPPADDTERLVADTWTSELERVVGRDDNFFDIGGHSLLAVKIFRRLADATGAPIALTDIFRYPTVRTFAAHLVRLRGDGRGGADAVVTPETPAATSGSDRGAMRRRALTRRGGVPE